MASDGYWTGVERKFDTNQIIVSKTDTDSRIIYANDTLINISGYTEEELLGKPHNLIRHSNMPRAVFKVLWDRIKAGNEAFAYIVNRCKNGDYYWVFAHVTPNLDAGGKIVGYHSCRRVPKAAALDVLKPFYAKLRQVETQPDAKLGLTQSEAMVAELCQSYGMKSYDHFIITLGR